MYIIHRGDCMAKTNLTISVDNIDKENFNKLVSELGLNVSTAINMFIKQSVRDKELPLNLSINNNEISEKLMDKYDEAFKELAK